MNILITGTSSGLGSGLAKYYLRANHRVYGISRRTNPELNDKNFRFLSLDLSDFTRLKNNLPLFINDIECIDLVILNAGILNPIKDLRDTPLDEITRTMNINVWANKVLIDLLSENLHSIGQIVAISSGASVSGSRGWNAYALSKATLNMLVKLYGRENPDTHFSALAPGLIDSGMQEYVYNLGSDYEEKFPALKKLKQEKRSGSMPAPAQAAEVVAGAIPKIGKMESGGFYDVRNI